MSLEAASHDLDERLQSLTIINIPEIFSDENLHRFKMTNSEFIDITEISPSNAESLYSVNNRIDTSLQSNISSSKSDVSTKCKEGKKFQKLTWDNEFYEGDVLLNNLHGRGFLLTQKNGQKVFYDGMFYVNKLEGYSQIFYENGTYFQGLFKQHSRFGPGVLTHPNGTQDVGFWNGFNLIRLACAVGSDTVPRLVSTAIGKTKLLCYRYLVPLCDENEDLVTNIFKSIGANVDVLDRTDEVLNFTVRNPNSLFFPKKFYDRHFFNGKDCTIKVAIDENDAAVSAEEEVTTFCEDDIFDRVNKLRSKIKEINESIEPFLAIRANLLENIQYCTKCCNKKESVELSKVDELGVVQSYTSFPGSQKEDTSILILDFSGLRQDGSFYDPSIPSADSVAEFDIEEALQQPSVGSSKEKIFEYCSCGEQREIEDLQHLEDQLENIIKQETFHINIRDNLKKKVERLLEKEEKSGEHLQMRYKLVNVTELLAWNNEDLLMQIQKHCFKHRNSEDMVNFSIPDLILGNRKEFGDAGEHEQICQKFLIACGKGKKDFVRKCLRERVNPNVCDARGNSGVFFAAAKDQIEIISILTDCGAKLDQRNDDELIPLSLCLLKYLSEKNKCDNWEKAFLTETETCKVPNLPKWYDIQSFLSLSSVSSKHSESADQQSSQNDYSNSRIVEIFRRLSTLQQKNSSFIRNVPNTAYMFDLSYKHSNSSEKQVERPKNDVAQNDLKTIYLTIMTLLDYGADPNVAKVPYPPLVLSLFTEDPDLVAQLLEANADVDVRVTDDSLSCLHIISSLNISASNVDICKLLLLFKCDPNLKTSTSLWQDVKSYFTGDIPQDFFFEESGKNALHLLCMRIDFENDDCDYYGLMAKTLIKGGVDHNETYLGHTPLSLAVLVGNVRLVKYLIKLNVFDPYESLSYDMGTVLTLFTLKRFENRLSTDRCKAMLTALVESDVNVLNKVGDSENAIEFAEKGDVLFNLTLLDNYEKKTGKGKAKPASKPKKADKHSQCAVITEFIKELGRETIIKQIQMISTETLYDFTEEGILENTKVAITLAEFLTPQMLVNKLEVLVHSDKIDHQRINLDHVKTLLNFVDLHKKVVKAKKGAKAPQGPKGKKEKGVLKEATHGETLDDLIAKANFKKSAAHSVDCFVVRPGFDDPSIYKICFHCLKGKDKDLKLCPRCQMIRFCSTQCNKLNLKVKTLHTCNIIFYDMPDEQIEDITKGESLPQLTLTIKENCRERLHKKRESRLIQEEMKLFEMWRADTYGTKFLKFKPLLVRATKKRKGQELSLNLDALKNLLERNFQKNPADFSSYSIDALLSKLNSQQRIQEGRKSARPSWGFRMESRVGSLFSEYLAEQKEQTEEKPTCTCHEKIKQAKNKRADKTDRHKKQNDRQKRQLGTMKFPYNNDIHRGQFEDLYADVSVREVSGPITKKLQKIPSKYQRFIQILGTYFPDVDVSFWLLPYACCSNGQLFYRFCQNEIFKESYSLT